MASESTQRIRSDIIAILALFFLTVALLSHYLFVWPTPLIFPNSDFHYGTDLIRVNWSVYRFSIDILRQDNAIALWRPYLLSGTPLIGHPAAVILYPITWLSLVLPLPLAINLIIVLHLWGAGVGVYLYLRWRVNLRAESAFIGALIFSQTPRLFAHIGGGHLEIIEALAWWPWAWFAFHSAWKLRQLRWMVLLGVALAVEALTFGTYLAMTGLWLGVCTLWEVWRGRLPALRFAVGGWLIAAFVALGLAAGQLVPQLQLLPYTSRTGLTVNEATGGLEPAFLFNVIFRSSVVEPESYTFLGISVILLVLFGIAAQQTYRERPWALAGFVTLILSLGTNIPISIYPILLGLIPVFSLFRAPGRWWPYTVFALSILAAWAVQKWLENVPFRYWIRIVVIALTGVYVGVSVFGQNLPFLYFPQVIVLPLLAVILLSRTANWKVFALIGIVMLDLWVTDLQLIVPQSESELIAPDPLVTFLQNNLKDNERVLAPYGGLPEAAPVVNRIYTADGYDPFIFSTYANMMRKAVGCDYMGYTVGAPPTRADYLATQACPTVKPQMSLFRLLDIRYVLLPQPTALPDSTLVFQGDKSWLYDIGQPLGRAFGVAMTKTITSCPDQLLSIDPSIEAITETSGAQNQARITILNHEFVANGEIFTVKADGKGFLVRSEVWASGWQATIDSQPATVERVDCTLQGLAIPEGTHTIIFTYDPLSYEIGWRISLLTVLGLLIYATWLVVYRRRYRLPLHEGRENT